MHTNTHTHKLTHTHTHSHTHTSKFIEYHNFSPFGRQERIHSLKQIDKKYYLAVQYNYFVRKILDFVVFKWCECVNKIIS